MNIKRNTTKLRGRSKIWFP